MATWPSAFAFPFFGGQNAADVLFACFSKSRKMISARDFGTVRVQAIAFSPTPDLQPTKVIALLLQDFADKFDGDLQSVGLPKEFAAEIPRAVLQSSDLRYRFEVGSGRLSSQWQAVGDESRVIEDVVKECVGVLSACVNRLSPQIGRLALVVSRACPCPAPAQTLIERFCTAEARLEPFNHSATFEIHNHKQYSVPRIDPPLTINSWVRCKAARLATTGDPAIVVDQDLNTLLDEVDSRIFENASLLEYFDVATREAGEILAKYFPG